MQSGSAAGAGAAVEALRGLTGIIMITLADDAAAAFRRPPAGGADAPPAAVRNTEEALAALESLGKRAAERAIQEAAGTQPEAPSAPEPEVLLFNLFDSPCMYLRRSNASLQLTCDPSDCDDTDLAWRLGKPPLCPAAMQVFHAGAKAGAGQVYDREERGLGGRQHGAAVSAAPARAAAAGHAQVARRPRGPGARCCTLLQCFIENFKSWNLAPHIAYPSMCSQ